MLKRTLKWLLVVIVVLPLLVMAVVMVGIQLIGSEERKYLAGEVVRWVSGAELEVGGDLDVVFFPAPRISAGELLITTGDGLLSFGAGEFVLEADWLSLLGDGRVFENLHIKKPKLQPHPEAPSQQYGALALPAYSFVGVVLAQTLRFVYGGEAVEPDINIRDLVLSPLEDNSALTILTQGDINNTDFVLQGRLPSLSEWFYGGGRAEIVLNLPRATLRFDGNTTNYQLTLQQADTDAVIATASLSGDKKTTVARVRMDDITKLTALFRRDLFSLLPDFVPRPTDAAALDAEILLAPDKPAQIGLKMQSPTSRVLLHGTIGNPERMQQIKLDAELDMTKVASLPAWPQNWPAPGNIRASGKINGDAEQLNIDRINIDMGGDTFEVSANGIATDITSAAPRLNLSMTLKAHTLSNLPFPLINSMPDDAILNLKGQLSLNADGTPALRAMDASAGSGNHAVQFHGDVMDLNKPAKFALAAQGTLPDIKYLRAESPVALPPLGPVRFKAKLIRDRGETVRAEDILIRSIDRGVSGKINGDILDLGNLAKVHLVVDAKINQLARFTQINILHPFTQEPATLRFTVRDRTDGLSFQNLNLHSGEQRMSGIVHWHRPPREGAKSRLSGALHFKQISGELLSTADSAAQPQLFSSTPLRWDQLLFNNLAFKVTTDTLLFHKTKIHNVTTQMNSDNKRITIAPFTGMLSGQRINARLAVQLKDGVPVVDFHAKTAATDDERSEAQTDRGKIDMEVAITGRGHSVADIVATANGSLYLMIHEARVKTKALHLLGADILTQIVDVLVPRSGKGGRPNLQCAALSLDFEDGISTPESKMLIRTRRVALAGEGQINLKDETLDIGIRTRAITGLGISPAAVAQTYKISGTLKKPRIVSDRGGLIKSGANLGIAIITGGVSLILRGLLDRVLTAKNACEELSEQMSAGR